MNYRLYCSSGNTVGVDEYVSYAEIDADGYYVRYLEINSNGTALRYTETHAADHLGILPEGPWDDAEASKPEYGHYFVISAQLFESVWAATRAVNA
ncbi:hypothetical protein ACG04R_01705 [Roseateles sp. BYS78W]|uniref:Uncharacterized protein n=1 Tax=Pelomonas candidula TaxID=3299025 RepID=A0ABW7H698_9BURK